MVNNESPKVSSVEFAINILKQAQQNLYDYDYNSAQVMIIIANQVLEDLRIDFDHHFKTEEMLKQLLSQSSG
ncbi:MAG: hypothetical protein NW220_01400 [Leptolyngbyaceae cyanobacterium bins.349]|nr:hypothetical protein [Leptolyngbyaceae cyanobacterium bins.349]